MTRLNMNINYICKKQRTMKRMTLLNYCTENLENQLKMTQLCCLKFLFSNRF